MNYLSEMLKLPVLDVDGEKLGVVNDFGIATGEVFPHVTSLAFRGPGKTPFMISWRKSVSYTHLLLAWVAPWIVSFCLTLLAHAS